MAGIPYPSLVLSASDRLDIVQGNPPVSPPGMLRIAVIAGVPSVSINGGAYAAFGSAGAAPSGCALTGALYLPTDRVDIIQGNPPVGPNGMGRLAAIAGVPSISINGSAYASLGSAGSAPTGGSRLPGPFLAAAWVDIIQGNPPVSLPGTARLANIAGVLSISVETGAYVQLGGISPPGTPSLWYDAQNIDGTNNSSLIDLQTIGTWKNLGSVGASGDLLQATAGLKPQYVLVASAGKLNNKSCVRSDGTRTMQTGAIATLNQPSLVVAVAKTTTVAGGICDIIDGRVAQRHILGRNAAANLVYAGSFLTPVGTWVANTYHQVDCNFNGASSVADFDGTGSGAVNPGTNNLDGVTIFSDLAAGSLWFGDIVELLVYNGGGQPTAAQVRTYLTTKYGATPQ